MAIYSEFVCMCALRAHDSHLTVFLNKLLVILLMEKILHHLGRFKNPMKNGKKYWVLTGAGFLKHQHYFTGKDKNKHPRVRARCLWNSSHTCQLHNSKYWSEPNRSNHHNTFKEYGNICIYMYMDMHVFCKVSKYQWTIRLVGLCGDADHVYIYTNIIAVWYLA